MNKYKSPTTPGLEVTFNNYVIEIVCLNLDPKLIPRFWKNGNKYWQAKYRREIKGVHNLLKNFESLEDVVLQRTIVDTVRKLNIQSMLAVKTVSKVVKAVKINYEQELNRRKQMALNTRSHKPVSSSEFVNVGNQTKLAKIRAMKYGQKTDCE